MKITKLWLTPVTKEVEIVEVSNDVIRKRTQVDPVEALRRIRAGEHIKYKANK